MLNIANRPGRKVVDNHNAVAFFQHPLRQMGTNETSPPGNQIAHPFLLLKHPEHNLTKSARRNSGILESWNIDTFNPEWWRFPSFPSFFMQQHSSIPLFHVPYLKPEL
jgi:hypothetical protein